MRAWRWSGSWPCSARCWRSSTRRRRQAVNGTRHPLHPALVHFPVACWSLATIADVASLWLGQPAWWLAGVLLVIGTIAALAAMGARSEERRVGTECVGTCRYRGSPYH